MHSGSSEVSSEDLIDTSSGEGDARMSPDGPIQGCSYTYFFSRERALFSTPRAPSARAWRDTNPTTYLRKAHELARLLICRTLPGLLLVFSKTGEDSSSELSDVVRTAFLRSD